MDKQKTPEEKLLKLIRKKKKITNESTRADSSGHSAKPSKSKIASKKKVEFYIFRNFNRALIVVVLCLFGYCLTQLVFFVNRDDPVPVALDLPERKIKTHKILTVREKPVEDYLREVEQHDIFQSPWAIKSQGSRSTATFSNLNKELKLVGIVLDDDSKALVLDLKNKQTLFLSEGEQVNGIFVEEISEDRVILLHNGQRVELIK